MAVPFLPPISHIIMEWSELPENKTRCIGSQQRAVTPPATGAHTTVILLQKVEDWKVVKYKDTTKNMEWLKCRSLWQRLWNHVSSSGKNKSLENYWNHILLFYGHRASLLFARVNPLSSKVWKKNGHSGSYTTFHLHNFQKIKKEAIVECCGHLLSILAQGLNYTVLSWAIST